MLIREQTLLRLRLSTCNVPSIENKTFTTLNHQIHRPTKYQSNHMSILCTNSGCKHPFVSKIESELLNFFSFGLF